MVFGLAEYDKKIYIPAGHVCRGNMSLLVRRSIIKKIYIPGGHVCRGNVSSLVWWSIIKKFTSTTIMLAEAMCSHWSGRVS